MTNSEASKSMAQDQVAQQSSADQSNKGVLVPVGSATTKDYRRLLADRIVNNWSQWATLAGFVPVPLLDLAAISGVQIKMIHDLCKAYEVPFSQRRVRAILSGLVGGGVTTSASTALAGSLVKNVPVIGTALAAVTQPALSYATTYAIGTVFVQHFESKGTLTTLSVESLKSSYHEQVQKAKNAMSRKGAQASAAGSST